MGFLFRMINHGIAVVRSAVYLILRGHIYNTLLGVLLYKYKYYLIKEVAGFLLSGYVFEASIFYRSFFFLRNVLCDRHPSNCSRCTIVQF